MAFFDTTKETELAGRDPLPAGDYKVVVKESHQATTKRGDGKYVATKLEVVGGASSGRFVFTNFNIVNPNSDAQSIGRSDYTKFLKACGKTVIENPDEVENTMLTVTLGVKKRADTGEPQNVVTKYAAANATTTTRTAEDLTSNMF